MKNLFLIIVILFTSFSCKQNERLIFEGDNRIYFDINSSLDTLSFSLLAKDDGYEYSVPVKVLGNTLSTEKKYKIKVDTEKSTAKEGVNYSIEQEFTFPANTFESDFKVKLFKTDPELITGAKFLILNLIPSDLEVAYDDRSTIVISMTTALRAPTGTGYSGDLRNFIKIFGPYSRKKHELIVEMTGHDFWDEGYGSEYVGPNKIYYEQTYYLPFARKLYSYILENVVYDENGVQIKPW